MRRVDAGWRAYRGSLHSWAPPPGVDPPTHGVSPRSPATCYPVSSGGAFSLIEVIISLAILSVGVFGAMRVFPVGLRASQRSELISRASLVGERTMETLKLQALEPNAWQTLGETSFPSDGPFEIRAMVADASVGGLADPARLKRVFVTVSWAQEGKSRILELVSYVRRPSS